MDINQIETTIMERQEAVIAFKDEAGGVGMELKKRKKILAEMLLKNRDKTRKPASLTTQKRSVAEAGAELEGIESVIETLESEIADLEIEKGVVELHQSQGKRFQAALQSCQEKSKKLSELSKLLHGALTDFSSGVSTIIETTATTRQSFRQILKDLPGNFSLQGFMSGTLEKVEDIAVEAKDREKAIEVLMEEFRTLSQIPSPSDEINLAAFNKSVSELQQWQTYMLKINLDTRAAFRYSKPRPDRASRRPLQASERHRYILAHQGRFDQTAIEEAKRGLAAELARSRAARETPRPAKTTVHGGGHGG